MHIVVEHIEACACRGHQDCIALPRQLKTFPNRLFHCLSTMQRHSALIYRHCDSFRIPPNEHHRAPMLAYRGSQGRKILRLPISAGNQNHGLPKTFQSSYRCTYVSTF